MKSMKPTQKDSEFPQYLCFHIREVPILCRKGLKGISSLVKVLNKKQRTYPLFLHTVCLYMSLCLELALLHRGGNNQSEIEVMQLSFVAAAPLLATALTMVPCGSSDKMFWDLAKEDCK